jgi:hypothetical protein
MADAPKTRTGAGRWAIAATAAAMAGAFLYLALGTPTGLAARILFGILGLAYAAVTWFAYKVDFRAWGGIILLDALALLLALGGTYWLALPAIASVACAYAFRLDYGVGAWKIEERKEQEERKRVEAERTRNALGVHCRQCGSPKLWTSTDGSAVCLQCGTGWTRAVPPPPPPPAKG